MVHPSLRLSLGCPLTILRYLNRLTSVFDIELSRVAIFEPLVFDRDWKQIQQKASL